MKDIIPEGIVAFFDSAKSGALFDWKCTLCESRLVLIDHGKVWSIGEDGFDGQYYRYEVRCPTRYMGHRTKVVSEEGCKWYEASQGIPISIGDECDGIKCLSDTPADIVDAVYYGAGNTIRLAKLGEDVVNMYAQLKASYKGA